MPASPSATYVVPAKPLWKSWTFWIQVVSIAIMACGFIVDFADVLEIDAKWLAVIAIIVNVLTAIRRALGTVQPVDLNSGFSTLTLRTTGSDGSAEAAGGSRAA